MMKKYLFLSFIFFFLPGYADGVRSLSTLEKLGRVYALEEAIPPPDKAAMGKVIDVIKQPLLALSHGFSTELSPTSFENTDKDMLSKYLGPLLSHCDWLTHLDLSDLNLDYLPRSIAGLKRLERLDLSQNNLRFISDDFLDLDSLKILKLKGNPVWGMSPKVISMLEGRGNDYELSEERKEHMKKGATYYEVRLAFVNKLFSFFDKAVKAELFDELVAGRLGFYPNGKPKQHSDAAKKFVKKKMRTIIHNVPYMTHINLSGYGFSNFPEALRNALRLKVLLLDHNNLNHVPEFIQGLRSLKVLDLSFNRFLVFPAALNECDALEKLYFSHNGLKEFGDKELLVPQLKMLDLSNNVLSEFPSEKVNFPHVEVLKLGHNHFKRLTNLSYVFPKIQQLDLRGCNLQALPPEYVDKVTGIPVDKIPELIRMHERVAQVNLLLFLVEFDKKELKEELIRGCIGIKENGTPRTLSDIEKRFVILDLDTIAQAVPWLTRINFQFMKLEVVPADLQKFSKLEILDLRNNYIKEVPDFIAGFKSLQALYLSSNELSKLPAGLEALPNLRILQLSANQIRHIDSEIGLLNRLVQLSLSDNLLRTLPDALFDLTDLQTLLLSGNPLIELSPLIGQLVNLEKLGLSNTQLNKLPRKMGKLKKLKTLQLNQARMRTLPTSLRALSNLEDLELSSHALRPESDRTGMGYKDIKKHFKDGDVLTISLNRHTPRFGFTFEQELYENLDGEDLSWNRDALKIIKVENTIQRMITAPGMLQEWNQIWLKMNVIDEDASAYLDFFMLTQYKKKDGEQRSNQQLMTAEFVPRMLVFLKTVYDLPLDDDPPGWIIAPHQKKDMQNVVAVIFKYLLDEKDPEQRARIFIQFVAGALMCQTGQKNNFETLLLSLSEDNENSEMLNVENFDQQLTKFLAFEKEKCFRQTVNDTSNAQSVHLLEYYKTRLCEILGLRVALKNYKDIHGIQGADPFSGSIGNVLDSFYDVFTPEGFIDKVLDRVATEEEVEFLRKKHKTKVEQEQAAEIVSSKPYRFATIVAYMTDNNLLTQHDLRDENDDVADRPKWEMYFEGHPHDGSSLIKPKAIEDILVHMGVVKRNG